MKERLIIIILAMVSGLIITTVAFFIYQNFLSVENTVQQRETAEQTTAESAENLLLEIIEPSDGALASQRTLSVKGVTNPDNIVLISSNQEDNSGRPSKDGNFSITINIDAGANLIVVRSIAPDGNEIKKELVVTYTTEEF